MLISPKPQATQLKVVSCGTCIFFDGMPNKGGPIQGGVCKRNPPQMIVLYGADVLGKPSVNLQTHFPPVSTGEWCGEHASAEDEDEGDAN